MRLIDADALQQIFNETSTGLLSLQEMSKDTEHMVRAFLMTTEMIHDAPTIDAEPVRHGHWEHVRGVRVDEIVQCSNPACRKETYAAAIFVRYGRYCPYCGAKMDEEVSDADT